MRPPLIPQSVPIHEHEPKITQILKSCYNHLVEHREDVTGRIVISLFMCLPSRKEFPEYYDIIDRPISMYEIRKRIEHNYYQCEDDCIADFKLMFSNCRFFNEDLSQIFKDAGDLERMLLRKYETLLREHGVGGGLNNSSSRHLGRANNHSSITNSNTNLHHTPPVSTPARGVNNHANNYQTNHVKTPDRSSPAINNHKAKHVGSRTTTTSKKRAKNNGLDSSNQNHHHYHHQQQQQQQQKQPPPPPQQLQHQHQNQNNQYTQQPQQQNYHQQIHNQISHSNQSITNGIPSDIDSNSNSNNYFIGNGAGGSTEDSSFIINHTFHNDTSIDSNSNLSAGPDSSSQFLGDTKKSAKRLKRDPNAPKKRLLTGYIIYAAEVRKEYVDKNPNQDFGFISRLIGNDWKALSLEARKAYDQRAMVHNTKLQEKALRDSMMAAQTGQPPFGSHQAAAAHASSALLTNGTSTPKMTKRKLAKLARQQARMQKSSTPYLNSQDNSFSTPMRQHDGARPSQIGSQSATRSSSDYYTSRYPTYSSQQATLDQKTYGKALTMDTATQTAPIRFVEPPTKRRFAYLENFRRYIESLEVPNVDLLAEETAVPPSERPPEPASKWLGAGIGRHANAEAALWALRDFMLQDSSTMRWNMQPYLSCINKQSDSCSE